MVQAITDRDIAKPFRRFCRSAVAARRLLGEFGTVGNLASQLLPVHGCKAIPVSSARRGDVMIADTAQGEAGGICLGAVAAFPGPTGLVFVPLLNCKSAWSV